MSLKSEIVAKVSQELPNIPERDIALAIGHVIKLMRDNILNNRRVEVRGFGSFALRQHQPRNAHNPKTGSKMITGLRYSVHFKPGKKLRTLVNANKI